MKVLTKDGNYLSVLFTVIFVLLFYFNNETLPNNLSTVVSQPCMYVAIFELLAFSIVVVSGKRLFQWDQTFLVAFLLVFIVIICGLFDQRFANGYYLLAMNILVAVTMVSLVPYKVFAKYFVQLVVFFSISSLLITYAIRPFVVSLPLPRLVNSSLVPFINAYICYLVDFDGYLRNTGIFREAGVWGGFLCISFILLVTNRDLFSKKTLTFFYVILVLTILSTFSTTSMISLALIYGFFILKGKGNSRQNFFLLLILAIVILVIARYGLYIEEFDSAFGKISTDSGSYQARTGIVKNAVPVMLSNPLGLGILNGTDVLSSANTTTDYHNTSTFVAGGVYFGWFFLIVYSVLLFMFCSKRLKNWLLVIPFALLMSGEQYIFNPWFYIMLFYGIKPMTSQTHGLLSYQNSHE